MADRPILFSSPMVRALLAGTKTQTRRTLNPQPVQNSAGLWTWSRKGVSVQGEGLELTLAQRIGVGDRLYVRESLAIKSNDQDVRWLGYAADGKDVWPLTQWTRGTKGIPSIHAPRWTSRITLTVTDVRVERLKAINSVDALAEGVSSTDHWRPKDVEGKPFEDKWWDDFTFWSEYPQLAYRELWEAINGPGSWDANPWVAAYTFTIQMGNIDQLEAA